MTRYPSRRANCAASHVPLRHALSNGDLHRLWPRSTKRGEPPCHGEVAWCTSGPRSPRKRSECGSRWRRVLRRISGCRRPPRAARLRRYRGPCPRIPHNTSNGPQCRWPRGRAGRTVACRGTDEDLGSLIVGDANDGVHELASANTSSRQCARCRRHQLPPLWE